jgi:hypothetical protein
VRHCSLVESLAARVVSMYASEGYICPRSLGAESRTASAKDNQMLKEIPSFFSQLSRALVSVADEPHVPENCKAAAKHDCRDSTRLISGTAI